MDKEKDKALVKNAADKEQVKAAGSKEKRRREKELSDIRELLRTPGGRRFMWRYLDRCGVYRSSFTGNSQTFFLEGERNIGLQMITDIMDADPGLYIEMIKENRSDKDA